MEFAKVLGVSDSIVSTYKQIDKIIKQPVLYEGYKLYIYNYIKKIIKEMMNENTGFVLEDKENSIENIIITKETIEFTYILINKNTMLLNLLYRISIKIYIRNYSILARIYVLYIENNNDKEYISNEIKRIKKCDCAIMQTYISNLYKTTSHNIYNVGNIFGSETNVLDSKERVYRFKNITGIDTIKICNIKLFETSYIDYIYEKRMHAIMYNYFK